jgi:hypothetical protein
VTFPYPTGCGCAQRDATASSRLISQASTTALGKRPQEGADTAAEAPVPAAPGLLAPPLGQRDSFWRQVGVSQPDRRQSYVLGLSAEVKEQDQPCVLTSSTWLVQSTAVRT